MTKITVVGTINKDLILPFGDVPIESFGGIFYDITFLAKLYPEATIVPVAYVGEDVASTVYAILEKLPNVSREGLLEAPQKNHKVILEYKSPLRREEKSVFPFPSLDWAQVAPHMDSDMIIVNMITGWDLKLAAFLKMAATARERIYLDLHYLTMGTDKLGRRFPRMPDHLADWLQNARFVQMNEDEYKLVAMDYRTESEFFQNNFSEDQVLLLTRDKNGATVVYRRDELVGHRDFPAYKIPRVVDTTGCGDAFGAGFVTHFLKTKDIFEAVDFANLVAAANATLKGTNEVWHLPDAMQKIKQYNCKI